MQQRDGAHFMPSITLGTKAKKIKNNKVKQQRKQKGEKGRKRPLSFFPYFLFFQSYFSIFFHKSTFGSGTQGSHPSEGPCYVTAITSRKQFMELLIFLLGLGLFSYAVT